MRGATFIPADTAAFFHDDVIVSVGPDTQVTKRGFAGMSFDIDGISVGQRITGRGVGATAARSMYARGLYNADTNVFTAWKIGMYLLEP